MGRSVNKVILVGNVGRDPDVATTASGTKVAHLSLATSRRVPRNDGYEERTSWHRLTLWDRLAQIAEDYIRKGTMGATARFSRGWCHIVCQIAPQTTRS